MNTRQTGGRYSTEEETQTMSRIPHSRLFRRLALLIALLGASIAIGADPATTMKAIRIHRFGGPEVLVLEDAPRPVPAAGEVMLRVYAAGVNPVDWKLREGKFRLGQNPPIILGVDVSGVVEQVGAGVTRFKAGDPVFAFIDLRRGGAYAEYALAREAELAAKPAKLSHVEAAATPVAALTAWQAFDLAGLKSGQTVLIQGAAGGVGTFAVQLAKARGAKVIGTASSQNHEYLKSLGVDQVIDYRTTPFETVVKDVDMVLDSIGGEALERSYGVLKKGGMVVTIAGDPSQEKARALGVRAADMLVKPNGAQLAEIAAMMEAGKVKAVVTETIPLRDVAKAHQLSQTGHVRGKLVLKIRD